MSLLKLLFYVPILLIVIGYYFDYSDNPARFKSDIRGVTGYIAGMLVLIFVERILFEVSAIYIILQIAVFIVLSFCVKFLIQRGKNKT